IKLLMYVLLGKVEDRLNHLNTTRNKAHEAWINAEKALINARERLKVLEITYKTTEEQYKYQMEMITKQKTLILNIYEMVSNYNKLYAHGNITTWEYDHEKNVLYKDVDLRQFLFKSVPSIMTNLDGP